MAFRFGSRVLLSSCLISFLLLSLVAAENRRPKNVQVSLRAKWPGTSLLLEAGELLSKQSNDLFWEFIDLWLEPDRGSDCRTARCCIQKIINDGRSLLSKDMGSIFEFSLTLRSASPRLVLYRQLAEGSLSSFPIDEVVSSIDFTGDESEKVADHSLISSNPFARGSCCWVDTGGTLLFNVPELISWLDTSSKQPLDSSEHPELFEFDHIYFDSSIAGPVAVLYGALGTECFKEFHVALVDASKQVLHLPEIFL